MPNGFILEQFEIGPLQNFLYFVGDAATKEIAVVDPAWDVPFLRKEAERRGYRIAAVLLTHGHPDHVNGLAEMLRHHPVPTYISRHEADFFKPKHRLIQEVAPDEIIAVGGLKMKCLHTPGHSPGCQCFHFGDTLIAGDTIFIDGCGRCDLPGSDPNQMYDSLYHAILKLPAQTVIYPGHNYGPLPFATVAEQKKTNPYLRCASREEFLGERM